MGGAFFLVKLLVKWSLPNPYTAIEDKPSHNARRFPCTDRSYPKMCFNCQVIKQSEVYFNWFDLKPLIVTFSVENW